MNNNASLTEKDILIKIYQKIDQQTKLNLFTHLLRGVATGLGITIGTSFIIAIFVFILQQFVSIPVIGNFVLEIVNFVENVRKQ
jgi:hypothetical protein